MAQEGRAPLTSGYAFRKRGSKGSMLLRQQVLFQDRDDAEAQILSDWWLGAETPGFSLAATEEPDSFSGVLVEGQNIALAATEAADTFSGELEAAPAANEFVLDATEAPDTVAMDVTTTAQPLFFSYGAPPQPPTKKEVEQEVEAAAPEMPAADRLEVVARVMRDIRTRSAFDAALSDVQKINAQINYAASVSRAEARARDLEYQAQALAALVAAEIKAFEIEMEDEAILLMAA